MSRVTQALERAREYASEQTGAFRAGDRIEPVPSASRADAVWDSTAAAITVSDELIQLAERLFQAPAAGQSPIRSVLFAGVGPEGGCSGVCAGTAEALSRQKTVSVCIVDANLRAPALSASWGLATARGLSNALLEREPVAKHLVELRENLWLLPAGSRGPEAQSVLTPSALETRLLELRDRFDCVLIDLMTNGGGVDLAKWPPLVDGVVLVMDADVARREVVRRTVDSLRTAGITILGAVLANRTYPIPEAIYRRL